MFRPIFLGAFLSCLTAMQGQDSASLFETHLGPLCRQGKFSGAALVAREGKPVFVTACGLANAEWNVANTPGTVFRIASITKQFTATAVLQLESQGKLSVQDPVCKYLDNCPAAWKNVTLHHLLTHTSGIPDFVALLKGFKSTGQNPVAETIQLFRDLPLAFSPGTDYQYSNSGYTLLAWVVEKTSGQTLAAYLKENVFDPVGMASTRRDVQQSIIPRRAGGYSNEKGGLKNAGTSDMDRAIGAGDLLSTVEDLLRWDQSLYTEKVLPKVALDRMFAPFRDGYAYGWMVRNKLGRQAIYHPGAGAGFQSAVIRFPQEKVTVIVLGNTSQTPSAKIAQDLAALAFDGRVLTPADRKAIPAEPALLEACQGEYKLEGNGQAFNVLHADGKLLLNPVGAPVKFELLREAGTQFFTREIDVQFTFHRDEAGKVTHLFVHQNGMDVKAGRVK